MRNRKEDIFIYLNTALFIVFALYLFSSLSGLSFNISSKTSAYHSVTEIQGNAQKAFVAEAFQVPQVHFSSVLSQIRENIPDFSLDLKNTTDNQKFKHQILWLQKAELLIQPDDYPRFYYHLFSGSEEPPVLS